MFKVCVALTCAQEYNVWIKFYPTHTNNLFHSARGQENPCARIKKARINRVQIKPTYKIA